MELLLERIGIEIGGDVYGDGAVEHEVPLSGPGTASAGDIRVEVRTRSGRSWQWSVTNRGDQPVVLHGVALVMKVQGAQEPLRMLRNGYQSWSPTGTAMFGVDQDPTAAPGAQRAVFAAHHADPRPARPGELRSEQVTVLCGSGGAPILIGFAAGGTHDGTLRLRTRDGQVELWAEAVLGGAELAAGSTLELHDVVVRRGDDADELLARWATGVGRTMRARTGASFQVGWCSWYQWFADITEEAVLDNLARSAAWPFDVFQVDDGFQSAIGDWTTTGPGFPSGLPALADAIAAAGRTPGLWLAPFLAHPESAVAVAHQDWFARDHRDRPLAAGVNEAWGGIVGALDTTHPEVLEHLESLAAELVAMGWRYLKLDFTYAPSFPGRWHDPTATPAQRVRAGYDAIRRGAGDETFILGCGAPLGPLVGVVDGMRIGPDVAPSWEVAPGTTTFAGYEQAAPSTRNAWRATLVRSFMHRRLWINDPDCVLLRTEQTALSSEAARAWAWAVGTSGGMVLVSDDLALLGADQHRLLEEVVALGRRSDRSAVAGDVARCPDLLEVPLPGQLLVDGIALEADPTVATAALTVDGVERSTDER